MNTHKNLVGLLSTALLALPAAAPAHHSRFVFDTSELVEIEGTIESVFWRNPHVMVEIRATGAAGDEAVWELEGGPVNALERAGIGSDALVVGASVTVHGFASSRDEHSMQPVHVDYTDGRQVTLSQEWALEYGLLDAPMRAALDPGQVERAIQEADGLFRVWVNTGRTYPQPRALPLRPAAQAAKDGWDQPSDDVALRCEPAGMPEGMVSPFPTELVDQGDTIVVRLEEWDNVRTIHMNPATAPEPEPGRLGHSVGRWEGEDLVVATDSINYPFLDDRGTPQSDAVEIVERFVMSDDGTRMDWHATLVDDATFTETVRLPVMHYEWVPGERIKPYNCTVAQ